MAQAPAALGEEMNAFECAFEYYAIECEREDTDCLQRKRERETIHRERETIYRERETTHRERETIHRERETIHRERERLSTERERLSTERERDYPQREREIIHRERERLSTQGERETIHRERERLGWCTNFFLKRLIFQFLFLCYFSSYSRMKAHTFNVLYLTRHAVSPVVTKKSINLKHTSRGLRTKSVTVVTARRP